MKLEDVTMICSSLLKAGCAAGTLALAMVALGPVAHAQSESSAQAGADTYSSSFPFVGEACHPGDTNHDGGSFLHPSHGGAAAYGIVFFDSGGATANHAAASSTASSSGPSSIGSGGFATVVAAPPATGGDHHDGGAPPAVNAAAPSAPAAGVVTPGAGTGATGAALSGPAALKAAGDPPTVTAAALPSATPEPATMVLIASGLCGIVAARRRIDRKSR
jgi:PEP-CTERM motif